jgi:long-subunit fatty acid transport protein
VEVEDAVEYNIFFKYFYMKRLCFLVLAILSFATIQSQNLTDALLYSTENLNGSARFNALSGAFGALGGDISSIAINPAGSAVFINSAGSATLSVVDKRNKSNYFGTNAEASYTNLTFNQVGFVFPFSNPNQASVFNKFSLGFNYIASNNYDDDVFIAGTGNTSIEAFFIAQANGVPLNLLQLQENETISSLYAYLGVNEGVSAQNAFLGYQGFIIEPIDPENLENTQYDSSIAPGSFNQKYYYSSGGYNGKYTFNFATEINNMISIGINLNSNNFNYRKSTFLNETNNNSGSLVNYVGFQNDLYTYGEGFSAQFGAIVKVTNSLRLGFTYDTPIWYNIYEETTQYIETSREIDGVTYHESINPRIINVFSKYRLTTPWKIAVSGAYIFGKSGLISFDYSYKDYSFTHFNASDSSYFSPQNTIIKNELKGASTIKIGGEYRINRLSLRGGYQYEGSPYKNNATRGDITGFSGGFGFYLGNYSLDFSYSRIQQKSALQLYDIGLTDTASIDNIRNNYTVTVIYEIN